MLEFFTERVLEPDARVIEPMAQVSIELGCVVYRLLGDVAARWNGRFATPLTARSSVCTTSPR
ncbi:MAG: hypothetical protein ACR2GZ_02430 [Solirubrobacteraceae bacterium]